jgi:hypothetical protein
MEQRATTAERHSTTLEVTNSTAVLPRKATALLSKAMASRATARPLLPLLTAVEATNRKVRGLDTSQMHHY